MGPDDSFVLRLPADANVPFHGVLNMDKAGLKTAGMLYPAPDPLTFLVAIAVHGIVSESMESHQKTKMEEEADRVLLPYKPIIDAYTTRELIEHGLTISESGKHGSLLAADRETHGGWLLDSSPSVSMTQDQRAIILNNVVVLYAPGKFKTPAYANSIRMVSSPHAEADVTASWAANDGEALKRETQSLYAQSLDVFLADVAAAPAVSAAPPPFKTLRYMQGGDESVERVQVLADHCDRLTLKNLRGWLMSVPAETPSGQDCSARTAQVDTAPAPAPAPAAAPEPAAAPSSPST